MSSHDENVSELEKLEKRVKADRIKLRNEIDKPELDDWVKQLKAQPTLKKRKPDPK